jgi:hypothetical protein
MREPASDCRTIASSSHVCRQYEPRRQNGPGLSDDAASPFFPNRLLRGTRLVWIENRRPRLGLPSNSSKRHCLPAVAMHRRIVEALEKLVRRYVANGRHR